MALINALGPRPAAAALFMRDLRSAALLAVDGARVLFARPASALTSMLAIGLTAAMVAPPERGTAPQDAEPAQWIVSAHPLAVYALQSPEFARAPVSYALRRRSDGSAREDVLTFGAFGAARPFLQIAVRRGHDAPNATFFVETARRAADTGLSVEKLNAVSALATRFGEGEYAEVWLSGADGAPARAGCQAFVVRARPEPLKISGLACGPDGLGFDQRRLACLIGRLDLLGAGDDEALKDIFAQAELRRDPSCAARARAPFASAARGRAQG